MKLLINESQLKSIIRESLNIKDGVIDVFNEHPELAEIGTPEQYSRYLDSIFPDSKMKDIVYHLGRKNIEKFNNRSIRKFELFGKTVEIVLNGIYFGGPQNNDTLNSRFEDSKKRYAAILNIKNYEIKKKKLTAGISDDKLAIYKKQKLDAVISNEEDSATREYVVFEPEQVHILGGEKDIQLFKNYLGK